MAAIVSVVASDNWNSNGSWVGGVQPGAGDDVTIAAGSVVTIPTGITALARSVTIAATATVAFATTSSVLTIGDATAGAGSVAFSNAGTITLTGIGTINFVSTSSTLQTITTGGQTMPNMTFNGVAGKWQLQDTTTFTNAAMTLTNGTLDWNGKTLSGFTFTANNSNTKVLTMGAAAVILASTAPWTLQAGGTTVSTNTAVITLSGAVTAMTFGSALNYNGTSFTFTGITGNCICSGTPTLGTLTYTGAANKTANLQFAGSFTCSAFVSNGASTVNRNFFSSANPGAQITVTVSASFTITNTDFMDTKSAGAAGTWTGTSLGDCLGNSGITFTVATGTSNGGSGVNRYWVGNLASWSSTSSWATTSGGSTGASVPLPQDDVYFDVNSFNGSTQRAQFDMPRLCRNLDTTGTTQTATTVGSASGQNNQYYGSVKLAGTAIIDANSSGITSFAARTSQNITSNGSQWGGSVQIDAPGGTYTLQDNFNYVTGSNKSFTTNFGTFDANGKNLYWQIYILNATTTSVKLGSGTWKIGRATAASSWQMLAAASVIQSQTSTITYDGTQTGTQTFAGGGATYNILAMTTAGTTGGLLISGSNYFDTINFSDSSNARTFILTITTLQIVRVFNVFGTSGKLMSVISSTGGTPAFLSIVGVPSTCDWLSVQDINASEPYKFYVGSNTTSVSGNTNLNTGTAASAPYERFTNYVNTSGNAPTVSAPFALTANAGDLVILEYFWSTSPSTVTPPSGFTQTQALNSGTGGAFHEVFYKVAVGGETSWATSTVNAPGIVGAKVMVIGGWTGTPTLDVTDLNNSGASSVTTLSTGSGVSNTTSRGFAIASWATNGPGATVSFSNSFEESRILTASSNVLSAVLPLTSTASRTSTAVWTSAHIAASQLAIFKDVVSVGSQGNFLSFM